MNVSEFEKRAREHIKNWTQEQKTFVMLCIYRELDMNFRDLFLSEIGQIEEEAMDKELREFGGTEQ